MLKENETVNSKWMIQGVRNSPHWIPCARPTRTGGPWKRLLFGLSAFCLSFMRAP
jgi:hypothetical protein